MILLQECRYIGYLIFLTVTYPVTFMLDILFKGQILEIDYFG